MKLEKLKWHSAIGSIAVLVLFAFSSQNRAGARSPEYSTTGGTTGATTGGTTGTGGGTKIDNPIPNKISKGEIVVDLQLVTDGFVSPAGMAAPDDGSGRMFVYDQAGIIWIVNANGVKMATPLLDVRNRLVALRDRYDERGLLGVATHPNFAQHPFIYTYTSEPNGAAADFPISMPEGATNNHQSVIAEWRIDASDPNRADPASRREILRADKPESNHNAGTLRFGPDGFLYFTIGDGGAADDQGPGHLPGGNAQNKSRILGKVSRIDVDGRTSPNGQYGIPGDNPFVGEAGVVQEIYAYGLRNPFSFSFDRQTGDLYLGDVGQNDVEEADIIRKGGNYGWHIKEGTFFFDPNGDDAGFVTTSPVEEPPADLIDPIEEFDHDEGQAIIGGYVYRGKAVSSLTGKYLSAIWGDFAAANGRILYLDGTVLKELRIGSDDHGVGMWIKGFGEDSNGELYVFGSIDLGPAGTSGVMLKIVPPGSAPQSPNSYVLSNLISDLANISGPNPKGGNGPLNSLAPVTDTNLVNPWGIAFGPGTPFWVSDNHAGVSTIYDSTGAVQSLIVTIPPPSGGMAPSAPTGIVYNDTTNFDAGGTPAKFIFATEDGTIAAWTGGAEAVLKADNSGKDTIYKGLTIASSGGKDYLYAADFKGAKIDVFDSNFQMVNNIGPFSDPGIPSGYAPFNVRNLGGNIYVTYAKQDDEKEDDVAGEGNGYIDIFDSSGKLVKRFASNGTLNSPWGLAMAPSGFGAFAGDLLAGNFGDGLVNAFDPVTGELHGQLKNPNGVLIWAEGLWDIVFGNGTKAGDPGTLYFTAGISGGGELEDHGLFGSIAPRTPAGILVSIKREGNVLTLTWTGGLGGFALQKKEQLTDPEWTNVESLSASSTTVNAEGGSGFYRIKQGP